MANDVTKIPWILDTAATITTDRVRCNLRWVGATTAGHTCLIKDNGGRVVWRSVASGANYVESDAVNPGGGPFNFEGFILDTIGSGILNVEVL